mgnify:CR=1 FL=1
MEYQLPDKGELCRQTGAVHTVFSEAAYNDLRVSAFMVSIIFLAFFPEKGLVKKTQAQVE